MLMDGFRIVSFACVGRFDEMSNSPQKLMNRGYFSLENIKITPVNYPDYIEHTLNIYKIAPVKPEIAPIT